MQNPLVAMRYPEDSSPGTDMISRVPKPTSKWNIREVGPQQQAMKSKTHYKMLQFHSGRSFRKDKVTEEQKCVSPDEQ